MARPRSNSGDFGKGGGGGGVPARGAWTEFGTRVPASELFSRGSSRRTAFSRAGTSFDDGDVASRRTAAPKPGRLTRSGSFESRIKPSSLKESAGGRKRVAVPESKRDEEYAGLSNQGSTCYLNSLLQTLYMTPELRHALYKWQWLRDRDGEQADCIPFQLQVLFGLLQLTRRRSITTTNLTKSFGWNAHDSFVQHDVQELCRVLFSTLEEALRGTRNEGLVDRLYKGVMQDVIRCTVCGTEHARKDAFLDVSLVVRPFGATTCVRSVEEAIRVYLSSETLCGSNQYFCDVCQAKVDAEKGLRFTQLPRIMALQLKRFDFDYATGSRVKLNAEVDFPLVLDMNPMMNTNFAAPPTPTDDSSAGDTSAASTSAAVPTTEAPAADSGAGSGEAASDAADPTAAASDAADPTAATVEAEQAASGDATDEVDVEAGAAPGATPAADLTTPVATVDEMLLRGPEVFELFSVMVHRGGTTSGHYFAYIKNLDDGRWYQFNDSTVTPATLKQVKSARGDGRSSTNAYMLMYRRVERGQEVPLPADTDVPAAVEALVAEQNAEAARLEEEARLAAMTLNVVVKHGKSTLTIPMLKTLTIGQATQKAWVAHGLAGAPGAVVELAKTQPGPLDGTGAATTSGGTAAAEPGAGDDDDNNVSAGPETVDSSGAAAGDNNAGGDSGAAGPAASILDGCEPLVPLERVRLRRYNAHNDTSQMPFDSAAGVTLDQLDFYERYSLKLEERAEGEEFPVWDPDAVLLRVIRYDQEADEFAPEVRVSPNKSLTLRDLKQLLEAHPNLGHIPAAHQRLMKIIGVLGTARPTELVGETSTLQPTLHVYANQVLYLERVTPSEPEEGAQGADTAADAATADGDSTPTTTDGAPDAGAADDRAAAAALAQNTGDRRGSSARTMAMLQQRRASARGQKHVGVSLVNSAALRRYERSLNEMTIKHNQLGSSELTESITIDKRLTLQHLRTRIADALCADASTLRLRQSDAHGRLFRNYRTKLSYVFTKSNRAFVERGHTLKAGQFSCRFMLSHEPAGTLHLGTPAAVAAVPAATQDAGAAAAAATEVGCAGDPADGPTEAAAGAPSPQCVDDGAVVWPSSTHWRQVLPPPAPEPEPTAAASSPKPDTVPADVKPGDSNSTAAPKAPTASTDNGASAPPTKEGSEPAAASSSNGGGSAKRDEAKPPPLQFMFELPLGPDDSINDVRQQLATEMREHGFLPEGKTAQHLRVRRLRSGALGSLLLDGLRVSDCSGYLTDTAQFGVQVLEEPETLEPDALLLRLQWFDRASWTCGPVTTVVASKALRIRDLGSLVAARTGTAVSSIRLFRAFGSVNVLALATATWCHGDSDVRHITEQPWNCGDGDLVMLSDSTTPLKQLTDDERALRAPKRGYNWFSGAAKGSKGSGSCSTASRYKNRDSAVLHIKTRAEREQDAKLKAEQEAKAAADAAAGITPVADTAASGRDTEAGTGAPVQPTAGAVQGSMRLAAIQAAAEERLLAQDLAELQLRGDGASSSDESEADGDFDAVGGNADDLLAMAAGLSSDDDSD